MTKRIIKGFAQFVNENLSENRMESLSNQMQDLKDQGYTVAEYEPSGGTDALGYLTMDGDRIEVPYADIDFDSNDAGLAEIIELIKEIASENGIDKVVFWDEDMIIDVEYPTAVIDWLGTSNNIEEIDATFYHESPEALADEIGDLGELITNIDGESTIDTSGMTGLGSDYYGTKINGKPVVIKDDREGDGPTIIYSTDNFGTRYPREGSDMM
jgi:hypothetical protein